MKHRNRPTPPRPGRLAQRLQHDLQVKAWAKRLQGNPEVRPTDLSEEQLTYLMREVHRRRPGARPDAELPDRLPADADHRPDHAP